MKKLSILLVSVIALTGCTTNSLEGYSTVPKHLPAAEKLASLPHHQNQCHKSMDEFQYLIATNPIAAQQKAMQINQRLRTTNMRGTVCYHVPGYMRRFQQIMLAAQSGQIR